MSVAEYKVETKAVFFFPLSVLSFFYFSFASVAEKHFPTQAQ